VTLKSFEQKLHKDGWYWSIILGGAVCFLMFYNLERYPAPWFDEGLNLQAAKNVALHGQYGLHSMEGFVAFHPAIQTGPTVVLPIAATFRLAGVGILQARVVVVFYTILALAAFYCLVRKTHNRRVALLASLLLIFTFDHESTSFIVMGRQVLGEVPTLAFLWLGVLVWFRAGENHRWSTLIGSGALWGLAMLTKVQCALILPVALIVFWLFDRVTKKELRIRQVLVPILVGGLCVSVWYGYQMLILGIADFWQQSTALGSAGVMHFLRISPRRTLGSLIQLSGSQLILFGLPGMLYTIGLGLRRREKSTHRRIFLVVFTLVWLGWYALLSIGWMRYAFVPAVMSTIFTAQLLMDLRDWAGQRYQDCPQRPTFGLRQLAIGGIVVMLLSSGMLPLVKKIVQAPDNGLQEFAHYLNANIPQDAVIESWEWEVDLLTDRTYHHPPYEITNALTERMWYGAPVSPQVYDFLAFHPDYLIRGPFARWTGIYPQDLLQYCSLVVTIGEYELYRVEE